jgi:hypothetical protein
MHNWDFLYVLNILVHFLKLFLFCYSFVHFFNIVPVLLFFWGINSTTCCANLYFLWLMRTISLIQSMCNTGSLGFSIGLGHFCSPVNFWGTWSFSWNWDYSFIFFMKLIGDQGILCPILRIFFAPTQIKNSVYSNVFSLAMSSLFHD